MKLKHLKGNSLCPTDFGARQLAELQATVKALQKKME
jgi:hypothetical protein